MSTKFGLLIDFDLLKAVTSTNTKLEVVLSGRHCQFKKWIWRHISAVGAPIWTKYGSLMHNEMQITRSKSKPDVEFQNENSNISAAKGDMSTRFGLLIDFDLLNGLTSTNTKLEVSLSGGGRHVAKSLWRHITAKGRPICTKFISLTENNTAITVKLSKMKPEVQLQYGGRSFFQTGSSYISAVNCDMWTKFGLVIHFGLLKAATSKNMKPEVVLSGRVCHLEKSIWRYISAVRVRYRWYLTGWCKMTCRLS